MPFRLVRIQQNPSQLKIHPKLDPPPIPILHSYNQFPSKDDLVTYLQDWLANGTQIYFFMHCPIEERSPHNAKYFQEMLEKANVPVPALPWNDLTPPPQQLTLF